MNAKLKTKQVKLLRQSLALRPIENLRLDDWADKYRFLAPSIASMPGKFLTSHVEIARGPMRAVTEHGVSTITLKVATQLFKTSLIENVLGFFIHQHPCPILCAFPKIDMAKSFSKERFSAMVRATPVLHNIMGDQARDFSKSSLAYKQIPGGFVAMESAGSPTNLAARPIRVTIADEIDKFEDLKFEGDPLLLLEERTSTFSDGLHIRCCSPTAEETSRIEKSYNESDMRRPFVACPHCDHQQVWDFFKHITWQKSEDGKQHYPLTATLNCESCGQQVEEDQRRKIITTKGAIRWCQTRPFTCCGEDQQPMTSRNWQWDEDAQVGYALCSACGERAVSNAHAGFTCSKIYSPWLTIPTLAEDWIAAKDDPTSKQVFYNTALGLCYSAHASKQIESNILAGRREEFPPALPKDVIRITLGVDSQKDRLELHYVGWSPDQAWSIHYEVIESSPATLETWDQLKRLLGRTFPSEWGPRIGVAATCIDTGGHHTQMAYNFCQECPSSWNVWPIKGSSWAKASDPVWPVYKSKKYKRPTKNEKFKPYVINTYAAKDFLREMLLTEEVGSNYFHIPKQRSVAWLDQLVSETPIFERRGGATIKKWHLPVGRANEAFDTLVYAYAALCGLKAKRGLDMRRLAEQMPYLIARSQGD